MGAEQTSEGIRAYALAEGEGKELPLLGLVKASSQQTGGSFELIEYSGDSKTQPPPHVHRHREEAFYVLDGEFSFTLGTEHIMAGAGSWVFIPRGTRHGFSAGPGAKALIFVIPAGLEGFFFELGSALAAGQSSQEIRAQLKGRYDSFPA